MGKKEAHKAAVRLDRMRKQVSSRVKYLKKQIGHEENVAQKALQAQERYQDPEWSKAFIEKSMEAAAKRVQSANIRKKMLEHELDQLERGELVVDDQAAAA